MTTPLKKFKNNCYKNKPPCWICKGEIDYEKILSSHFWFTIDHYLPKSCGGKDNSANLRASHDLCNHRRGDAYPEKTKWIGDILTGRWHDENESPYLRRMEDEIILRGKRSNVGDNNLLRIRAKTLIHYSAKAKAKDRTVKAAVVSKDIPYTGPYKNGISTELL